MKLFVCWVLLPFVTMVGTAPVRARRENVLSFLNDALGTTTEKPMPAPTTAYRKPPSEPVKEQDSEDMSEAQSTESFDTNGFTDAFKDPNSDEITIPKVVEKDKAPPRRTTGVEKNNMRQMDISRPVWDQGSRDHSGPQAGRERTDLNSDEGMMVDAQKAENLSGKQAIHLSGGRVTDNQGANLQRKAAPGRVTGVNGMLAPGRSRELLDWDSLEGNNNRPAPVGNRGDTDYDDTREFISSETYPIAPPEHMPASLSVPAKSQAT